MAISLRESVIVGLSDLWIRKVRTIVTVMGIVLGTMSIIVVLSLVKGVNKMTEQWLQERGGATKISVERNWEYNKENNERWFFTFKELRLIESLIPEALYFNPQFNQWQWFRAFYNGKEYWTPVMGVFPDFTKIEEWTVQEGRFLNDFDVDAYNDVIVIGTAVRDELFGNENPIGKYFYVMDRKFQVIGVMKHRYMKSRNQIGDDNALAYLNRRCFVPLSTVLHKVSTQNRIQSFDVKLKDVSQVIPFKEKLDAILLNLRHGHQIFIVESAKERIDQNSQDTMVFKVVFIMISSISLFVGGIVITNIMLATIQERTREIGIRMATGARRFDIFVQFMVQTVLTTLIGGILGVMLGVSIVGKVSSFIDMEVVIDVKMIVLAVIISVGVGLVFGIAPAIHASNLNPVKALRYE